MLNCLLTLYEPLCKWQSAHWTWPRLAVTDSGDNASCTCIGDINHARNAAHDNHLLMSHGPTWYKRSLILLQIFVKHKNGSLNSCLSFIFHCDHKNLIENLSKTPETLHIGAESLILNILERPVFVLFLAFFFFQLIGTEIWQVQKVPQHRENGHTRECKIWWQPRYSLNPVLGFIITFNVVLRCHNSCPHFFFNMQRAI